MPMQLMRRELVPACASAHGGDLDHLGGQCATPRNRGVGACACIGGLVALLGFDPHVPILEQSRIDGVYTLRTLLPY